MVSVFRQSFYYWVDAKYIKLKLNFLFQVNDDTMWRESLNKFLHTWSSIVHDKDGYSNETLVNPCIEIFNTYLQCRLAPPDGTR